MNITTEMRNLTTDEIDAVEGGRILMSFNLFGLRFVMGETADGTYACVNGPTSGSCVWDTH